MEPVTGTPIEDDPEGSRPVLFRELRSVIDTMTAKEKAAEERRKHYARGRRIGWALKTVLIATTLWIGWFQFHSEAELRHSLYETCMASTSERQGTAAFYRQLGAITRDKHSQFMILLDDQIKRLEQDRDCAGKYL